VVENRLYVDGRWTDGTGDAEIVVLNPATEREIGRVPEGSVADVESAILAARRAFDEGPWGRTTPRERAVPLRRFVERLVARKPEIVDVTIAEAGAPRRLAEGLQVQNPLDAVADMVDRVLATYPFVRPMSATFGVGIGQGVVRKEPAGVVAAITPFNYPFFVNMYKVAPALAAGCTMVLKPSPFTPLAALLIAEIADEAGLPPGVLNVVTGGIEAGRRLTAHPAVDVVTFTGSGPVGSDIMRQAADTMKRIVLELGGKSANIILPDANLDRAVPFTAYGFTRHSGQGCACLTRVLVHESRYDEAVERLVAELAGLRVGDPDDPATDMGPLIRESQRARVERYIAVARHEGARLVHGGGRPAGLDTGYYVEPTLFADVKSSMRIAQEEVFGPVGVMIPFGDDAEAVAIANDSAFGLSGAVWSGDPARAYAVAGRMRTGTVTLNGGGGGTNPHGPFGGYKRSGIGREFGEAGLEEYLETKTVGWGVAGG
jgi:aldehyde dehydrogenase (NAD+)